ncbi:hypothetical protein JL721_7900 [Aureococcus anophagefferens]|nr:hypothetical protein JL721_7900 [Aureococcus anophagefferens]
MASVAPEGEKYAADAPAEQKMLRGPQPDGGPLPDQPSLMDCGDGASVCGHKGTKAYPANPGMLDAGAVSGTYDCPAAPCASVARRGPAVGFLCMCPARPGARVLRHRALQLLRRLGYGGTPIDFLYLPTGKCLPKGCTLAATWFCIPGPAPCCIDFHDVDTMVTSWVVCCPRVHKKLVQGTIIF